MAGLSTLTDTFDTLSAAKWTGWGDNQTATAGQLRTVSTENYSGIDSAAAYTLDPGGISAEVIPPASPKATTEIFLGLIVGTRKLQFDLLNGTLSASRHDNGTRTSVATVAYSASAHRWWRISRPVSTVWWETSPDAVTWTKRAEWAPDFDVPGSTFTVQMGSGEYVGGPNGDVVFFDNVNIYPTPPPPVALDDARVGSAVINAVRVGSTAATALYVGGTKVWP